MQTAVFDAEVHHAFIDPLRRTGCAPSRQQVSAALARPVNDIEQALRRLSASHGVVLHPHVCELVIHARIGGEMEDVDINIVNGEVVEKSLWVHFAVPPRAAWDNVHHFCATVLPFRQAADVRTWSNRHGLPVRCRGGSDLRKSRPSRSVLEFGKPRRQFLTALIVKAAVASLYAG
jgi:hypothetical protein